MLLCKRLKVTHNLQRLKSKTTRLSRVALWMDANGSIRKDHNKTLLCSVTFSLMAKSPSTNVDLKPLDNRREV